MINYCWDTRWEFNWNQKKTVRVTQSVTQDGKYENGIYIPPTTINEEVEVVTFVHSASFVYILQDENKGFIKYETAEVILSETQNLLTLEERTAIAFSETTKNIISTAIADAKQNFANYTI